jgi:hypothetical protein
LRPTNSDGARSIRIRRSEIDVSTKQLFLSAVIGWPIVVLAVLVARATLAVSSLSVGEYVGWLFLASAPVAIAIVILRGQSAEPIAQVLYDAEHVAESRPSAPVADRRG